MHHDGFTNAADARDFVFGGNATFTIQSLKTGKHFTFKVSPKKGDDNSPFFVNVKNGPEFEDRMYIGFIPRDPAQRHSIVAGRKGHPDAPSFKALNWVLGWLAKGALPSDLRVQHEGSCCRCGRQLTHPESIASGIGPECAKKESL